MGGGLIQIASYGINDMFLIGDPQITFFKTVYRKHTNFSMEYIEEQFTGLCNFGTTVSCNLSKTGDLLHKLYLKVELPQVALNKLQYSMEDININNDYTILLNNYTNIQNFINIVNFSIINPLYNLLLIDGITYNDINSKYNLLYNNINYNNILYNIINIKIKFNKSFMVPLYNNKKNISNIININTLININTYIDFDSYYKNYISNNNTIISDLKILLDNYILQLNIIKNNIYDQLNFYKKINTIINRNNLCFSWVEYLGHQLIQRIELVIGGKVIDFYDSVRINIHHQISTEVSHIETYNKLIGNIPQLTTYNSNIKPAYILYIPIDFWFSKYSGLSIPMIFLKYHDVQLNIVFNDLINCCYYENINSNIIIENLINLNTVTLICNYIYLDTDERKKFGQLSHEYLIDQTQIIQFLNYSNISNNSINLEISFFNPVKQLFWVIRNIINKLHLKYFDFSNNYYVDIYEFQNPYENTNINKNLLISRNMIKINTTDINISNFINIGDIITIYNSIYYNGIYKVINIINEYIYIFFDTYMKEDYKYNYFYNTTYQISDNYIPNSQAFICKIINSNTINNSTLELNGIQRFSKLDNIYTNFVQSYQCNTKSPNFGVNTYSFALKPEDYQPSGFCNYNKIDLKMLILQLTNNNITNDILIYAHSYNILKFEYGKAVIALNI